ncbi:MAG: isochorismatase family protein, partial [Symploca sp. SIO2E6]|nr:isochorismatase family protein [Symploca sp. SIO2E6]
MLTTFTTPDSTLATIEAALPIDPQPYSVSDRSTGLIVVDVINGFCTVGSGPLAPTEPNVQIETMVAETNRLAQAFTARGLPVLAFLDTHEPGKPEPPYPNHCEKGTGEEKLVPQLAWLEGNPYTTLIEKD